MKRWRKRWKSKSRYEEVKEKVEKWTKICGGATKSGVVDQDMKRWKRKWRRGPR